jgi:replicative DNA helicase
MTVPMEPSTAIRPRPAQTSPGCLDLDLLREQLQAAIERKTLGWKTFDSLELGMNPGELAVVAGRTGHGKSTVLLNVLIHWMETYPDQVFVLFSYEIPADAVAVKLASQLTRRHGQLGASYQEVRDWARSGVVPGDDPRRRAEIEDGWARMRAMQDRLRVIYDPDMSVTDLGRTVEALRRDGLPLGGLFVDYIQLVGAPEGRFESREAEIKAIAKDIKLAAVRADCPVLVAAQIDREVAKLADWIPEGSLEDDKVLRMIAKRRPQLHHLSQGGGDQEADLVIGILNYQADFLAALEDADIDPTDRLQTGAAAPFDIAILKNRYGQLALATVVLESRTGYLRDPGVFGR